MSKGKLEERIAEITRQPVRILNGMVGKGYEAKLDFDKLGWKDITTYAFDGLEEVGLQFNDKTRQFIGVPTVSGDISVTFKFKIVGQTEDASFSEKPITLIINPDPRTLWKNIESDKNDPYYKPDDVTVFAPIGDRHIVVSSKRGRSHANVGSFREDDFAFKVLHNGWNIVVVSDGAGSAPFSRKGSVIACERTIEYFLDESATASLKQFDVLLQPQTGLASEEIQKNLNRLVYDCLGGAAVWVHKKLAEFVTNKGLTLKDVSTTLIFTLFKKFEKGYAFLSFGVGDCPIAVLNKEFTEVHLMNRLDVGEFGGGTRFITMPEIFQNANFSARFGFKMLEDFSYLFMMSDGIYDPKFAVESNLGDIKKWQAFLSDLGGKNDEGIKVELKPGNKDIKQQLSAWMDFWSAGNHDDRTLAIVF